MDDFIFNMPVMPEFSGLEVDKVWWTCRLHNTLVEFIIVCLESTLPKA